MSAKYPNETPWTVIGKIAITICPPIAFAAFWIGDYALGIIMVLAIIKSYFVIRENEREWLKGLREKRLHD